MYNKLPPIRYRDKGAKYLYQNRIVIWDGRSLKMRTQSSKT